jgi:hypothetical protein
MKYQMYRFTTLLLSAIARKFQAKYTYLKPRVRIKEGIG